MLKIKILGLVALLCVSLPMGTQAKNKNTSKKEFAPIKIPDYAPRQQSIFDTRLDNAPERLPAKEIKSKRSGTEINFGINKEAGRNPSDMANPIHDAEHEE